MINHDDFNDGSKRPNLNSGVIMKFNILFLCTHNSARSILAEALASMHPSGKFVGYSAGSNPGDQVNPYAFELVKDIGYDLSKVYSKSWDEYAKPNSPEMDFIITVCDNAAEEVCPVWPGNPASAHWGFQDPSLIKDSEELIKDAFNHVFIGLKQRIDLLADLSMEDLDEMSIHKHLVNIHKM